MKSSGPSSKKPTYELGAIVECRDVPDGQGNAKDRPVVLIDNSRGDWLAVAISSSEPREQQGDDVVEMGHAVPFHPKTGLDRPCWAYCKWIVTVSVSQFIKRRGRLLKGQFEEIVAKLPGAASSSTVGKVGE